MPWVDMLMVVLLEMKSSNWFAQETRSQAASGKEKETKDEVSLLRQKDKGENVNVNTGMGRR